MKRQLPWLIAMPLAVVGTLAGHSVGYWAAVPDAHERAHVLAASGHGYLHVRPARARALRRARRARVRRARARCLQRTRYRRRHPDHARRRARTGRIRAAGADRAVRCTTGICTGSSWCPRRSCSDWRRRCRSRSWRPPSPSRWQPRRSTSQRRSEPLGLPRPRRTALTFLSWLSVDLPPAPVLARGYAGRGPPLLA